MRINCLACGHNVDLDNAYDDYEGLIKCCACRAVLEIRAEQGRIKAVKQANGAQRLPAKEALEGVLNPRREAA